MSVEQIDLQQFRDLMAGVPVTVMTTTIDGMLLLHGAHSRYDERSRLPDAAQITSINNARPPGGNTWRALTTRPELHLSGRW
jgi:hypothetical protein